MKPLNFVVIGFRGFAAAHIAAIKWLAEQGLAKLAGVIALEEERSAHPGLIQPLIEDKVALFPSINDFFSAGATDADILTVPIGIHQHVPVSIAAMESGLDVYCEKPVAATIQEVDQLIEAEAKTRRRVAIGFQHIYSASMGNLKDRICDGRLGAVKSISLVCGWPRSKQYYSRNDWAGRLRKDSHWILDTPANNANAHYLFNMLYLASSERNHAADPVEIRSELYRAYKIESADTTQLKFKTNEDTNGHIILTHCNERETGPMMRVECEKGQVDWRSDNGNTTIRYQSGKVEEFDNLIHDHWRYDGFKDFVRAVHDNTQPICTPHLARCHTLAVNAMHESCPEIVEIGDKQKQEVEDWEMFPPDTRGDFVRVSGMNEFLERAYQNDRFFSELEIPWARAAAQPVNTVGYHHFPKDPQLEKSA